MDRLKAKGFRNHCAYLHSVDKGKSQGRVNVVFLYSSYESSTKELPFSLLCPHSISVEPQKVGGFGETVHLPLASPTIKNPFHSPRIAKYLINTWMDKLGLWPDSIIVALESATNKSVFNNSAGIEGVHNHDKNHTSTFREDMSSLPHLFDRRWNDSYNGNRLAMDQLKTAGFVIESRVSRKEKEAEKCDIDIDEGGVHSEMKWGKKGKPKKKSVKAVVVELERYLCMMNSALENGKKDGVLVYDNSSMRSKWKVLKGHASLVCGQFMGHVTFTEWCNGKRELSLKDDWVRVIESFCRKYGGDEVVG